MRYEALERPDTPFYLHASYTQPHDSFQSVPKYLDQYSDIDIALPRPDSEPVPDPATAWLAFHRGIDQFPPTAERIRASREACYAMISHLDELVGDILAELKLLGLHDDTLIVFTSDQGDMMGERNMWFKRTFWEHSVKVPLVFHRPPRLASRRVKQSVTLADLCPAQSEIGGAEEFCAGWGSPDSASFSALSTEQDTAWRDTAVMQHFGPGVEAPWSAIRREDSMYVYIHDWGCILINLADDPDETNDLAGDPEHAGLAANLHDALVGQLDLDSLSALVKESKKQRCFLRQSLKGSLGYFRDHQPEFDASKQYVRGGVNKPVTC